MHAVKPYLEATKGSFVTTASLAGVKPEGSSLPYAISKAAQIYLAKTLSEVCAPNIRVNSLAQAKRNRLKRLVTVQVRVSIPTHYQFNINMRSGHRECCSNASPERIYDWTKRGSRL
ncbi:hypothetical protein E4T44_09597 [Aureobasidium sp. EXF-8845]|nr:hypothetical protein E4T45_10967 [Aureobasidium sp. EXF-8846]KAI4831265.1 hypothetical protein E4T44_09597 [Aureobasidium sp. EXF-8845]